MESELIEKIANDVLEKLNLCICWRPGSADCKARATCTASASVLSKDTYLRKSTKS